MKFENIDVQNEFYKLYKKYNCMHINLGNRYNDTPMTYEDVLAIEENLKLSSKFLDELDNE
ncbi:hypothetical protein H8S20_13185 [Clostridium sp. NSJ-6]|uniref:Uncharacterized protein n=1 Tax=Clostridium hominis TaxID=2763036 RepID=A0ABR7DEG9_9CLOT|nr:hypothetical protein [Clostridium hominis]MBC5629837.1 hypothetical protein [Clostridium hominis]